MQNNNKTTITIEKETRLLLEKALILSIKKEEIKDINITRNDFLKKIINYYILKLLKQIIK